MSREIQRSFRENFCSVVMLCDIDHFKRVNDQYGHSAGDDVLREVARRLQHAVRSYDMVGRYGGEEFLILLNRCDPASAMARGDNLRKAISCRPMLAHGESLEVTISVGLARSCDHAGCDADEIIQKADTALYVAKAAGRNCVRVAGEESAKEEASEKQNGARTASFARRRVSEAI